MNIEFLENLTNADGVPGNEKEIYNLMKEELVDYADDIYGDNIGSFIAVRKNENKPKVMLTGHMDEVGFMVKSITDEGFVKFATVGGWYDQVLLGQRLRITTRDGKKIEGVIGAKPPHVIPAEKRKEVVKIDTMFLDLGVESKEEVENLGVQIGDMITPVSDFTIMNNPDYLCAKAFDNRVGCFIAAEVMKNVAEAEINCELYATGSVQEEVGLRGAKTLAHKVKPDLAITIDTGIAGDTPGMTPDEASAKLGDGPQLLVLDGSGISHIGLRHHLIELAKELEIDLVLEILKAGGTDNGQIHLSEDGVVGLSMVVTTRYLHTHTSIISKKDVESLTELLTQFILRFDEDVFNKIKEN